MADDQEQPQTRIYEGTTMGFALKFRGPATVDVYNKKADSVTGCLDDACENTLYRSTFPEFQDAFAPEVEKFTGIKREVNVAATEAAKNRAKDASKVKDILETVPKYVKRAIAGLTEDQKKDLAVIAQRIADTVEIDPAPSKRQAKIPADLMAKAESVLDLDEAAREAKITKWSDMLAEGGATFELDRDENGVPVKASLARMVQEVVKVSL